MLKEEMYKQYMLQVKGVLDTLNMLVLLGQELSFHLTVQSLQNSVCIIITARFHTMRI